MFLRVWCDQDQIKKIKVLPSCYSVKNSRANLVSGGSVTVYIVIGNDVLQKDIDRILDKDE